MQLKKLISQARAPQLHSFEPKKTGADFFKADFVYLRKLIQQREELGKYQFITTCYNNYLTGLEVTCLYKIVKSMTFHTVLPIHEPVK